MPCVDILRKVAAVVGTPDYITNANTRALLLDKINSAAREIWREKDLPGALREITARVYAERIVGLPSFVGSLRAMRENATGRPWTLNDLRPRYHWSTWQTNWNNWRLIGYSPTQVEVTNQAPVTLSIDVADPTLIITLVGATAEARRASETVTMDATTKTGTINFTKFDSIAANKVPSCDVMITDAGNTELATLFSDSRECRYILVDVSKYPNNGECADGTYKMDILYKMHLPVLTNDSDVFPVPDYDDIIALKTVQLYTENQEGKEQRAVMAQQKAEMLMDAVAKDQTGTVQKRIQFAPNPLLGRFSGRRANISRRMSGSTY